MRRNSNGIADFSHFPLVALANHHREMRVRMEEDEFSLLNDECLFYEHGEQCSMSQRVFSCWAGNKRKAKTGKKRSSKKYFFRWKIFRFFIYVLLAAAEREPVALQQSYEWARLEERYVNFWFSAQRLLPRFHPHVEFNYFSSRHDREGSSVKEDAQSCGREVALSFPLFIF